jgi:hypothetical protein
MSFGEGNLHERIDKLADTNGYLCSEVNRLAKENEKLSVLVRDMYKALLDVPCGRDEIGEIMDRVAELGLEDE